jgi:hypothetical protein
MVITAAVSEKSPYHGIGIGFEFDSLTNHNAPE